MDCGFRFNTTEITDKVGMKMSKPWENSEGYPDFTAYHGINNAMAERNLMDKTISCVIGTLKGVARLAGFDIVGRIVLRDIETGREYR